MFGWDYSLLDYLSLFNRMKAFYNLEKKCLLNLDHCLIMTIKHSDQLIRLTLKRELWNTSALEGDFNVYSTFFD